MKKNVLGLLSLSLISSTMMITNQAFAVEGLTANIAATNNYIWRGLEQTHGNAAISGGIDYISQSGFYIGTWTSNADWASDKTIDSGMTYELDIYGGYSGEFKALSYDVGFTHYAYPDSNLDSDFTEVFTKISYGVFTLGYATLADADGYNFGDDSYINADIDLTVAKDLNVNLHVGTGIDKFYAGESFIEYGINLSKSGFTFGLSKNDLDNSELKAIISYQVDINL
jgi:uncharacterized protein (TIGR02001 family)